MDDDLIDTHIYKVVEIAKLKTRGKIHTLLMWWSGLRKSGLTGKPVLVGYTGWPVRPQFQIQNFQKFYRLFKKQ